MSKITEVFSHVLGIPEEKVTDDLSPQNESSWDSLNAIILITELEHAFGIQFGYDEAMQVKNVGDARRLIASKGKNPDES